MNERIPELLLEAHTQTKGGIYNGYPSEWSEKFAKLIVRECIEQGKQVQSQTVSNGSEDYNDGRKMGIEVFMNQIKWRFGIEE